MGASTRQRLVSLCRHVLCPLIEADEGKLYLVSADDNALALHLGGNCSGCPGAPLTIRTLIEPAVRSIAPDIRVTVTVGAKKPAGAVLVERDDGPDSEGPDTETSLTSPETSNGPDHHQASASK